MCPDVSVIIPCYNHGHYLSYALESVLAQTYNDWEAIVVDDGSSDNTPEVTAQLNDPRIRYIYQNNQGLSSARNTGICASLAEAIALLDADDVWDPNFLEKMMNSLANNPQSAAVYCGYKYIDQDGINIGFQEVKIIPAEKVHDILYKQGNWLLPSSVIFRKGLAEAVGLFDESLQGIEEWDLWIKLSALGSFICVPNVLVGYRRHGSNISNNQLRKLPSLIKWFEKNYGNPEGSINQWTSQKREAYVHLYRFASTGYLADGKIKLSASYFLRMLEISPKAGCEMYTWRKMARVHLPLERRNVPALLEWTPAIRNVFRLLDELHRMRSTSFILQDQFPQIKGSAYVALAREAVEANEIRQAMHWLLCAVESSKLMLFVRPFWGTLIRALMRFGKQVIQ